MASKTNPDTVTTRFCIISDTHTQPPLPSTSTSYAYRYPLPSANVLLHAGDITMVGRLAEYKEMMEALVAADAELKIIIAGNHDITLHEEYYIRDGKDMFHRGISEDLEQIRELWTGEAAKKAGIVYLEEGTRTFDLSNGARFTASRFEAIYTSPWQPEFYNWAFNYNRDEDRFNSNANDARVTVSNPVPSWPAVDIMLTHGPPHKILDKTDMYDSVGCEHLLKAVQRCRPRLHCFGHIHEGWGAEKRNWAGKISEAIRLDAQDILHNGSAYLDLTQKGHSPLQFGEETVFVNAAIMTVAYEPRNAPWVLDLDLPVVEQAGENAVPI